jgi:hypothetical protein
MYKKSKKMSFQVTRLNNTNTAYNNVCKKQVIIQKGLAKLKISPDVTDVLATCDYSVIYMEMIDGMNMAEFMSMFGKHDMRKQILTAINTELKRVLDILLYNVSNWKPMLEHIMINKHGKIFIINFVGCELSRDKRTKVEIMKILFDQLKNVVKIPDNNNKAFEVANGFLSSADYVKVVSSSIIKRFSNEENSDKPAIFNCFRHQNTDSSTPSIDDEKILTPILVESKVELIKFDNTTLNSSFTHNLVFPQQKLNSERAIDESTVWNVVDLESTHLLSDKNAQSRRTYTNNNEEVKLNPESKKKSITETIMGWFW